MSIEVWLAFAAATTFLVLTPGPTVLLVISSALGRGRAVAAPMAAGVALGDFTAITISLLGVGALLQASATLFTAVKLAGAAYLVWMGVQLLRPSAAAGIEARHGDRTLRQLAFDAWLVTTFNPKGILFFIAFMPQFFDPAHAFLPQAVLLTATFCGIAFLSALNYGLMAGQARSMFADGATVRWLGRLGGGALVMAGLATALVKRPT